MAYSAIDLYPLPCSDIHHKDFPGYLKPHVSLSPVKVISVSDSLENKINTKKTIISSLDPSDLKLNTNLKKGYSFISNTLSEWTTNLSKIGFEQTNDRQLLIEKYIFDEYELSSLKNKRFIRDIDSDVAGAPTIRYIQSKNNLLILYTQRLRDSFDHNTGKQDLDFMGIILNKIESEYIHSLCIHTFLQVLTYQDSDNEDEQKNLAMLTISIKIGKKLVKKYFQQLLSLNSKDENSFSFSLWKNDWIQNNKNYADIVLNSESFSLDKLFDEDTQLTDSENTSPLLESEQNPQLTERGENPSSLSPLLDSRDIGENTSPLDMHHDSLYNNFENRLNDLKKIELENNDLENTSQITESEGEMNVNKIESTLFKNNI